MNYYTHKLIAAKFYDRISAAGNVQIDRDIFIESSVAPDVTPSMVIVPHTFGCSKRALSRNLHWLIRPGALDDCCRKEFSYRLAIVMHYIADFFCAVHNRINGINPFMHTGYELKLHKLFKNAINTVSVMPYKEKHPISYSYIMNYICDLHKSYRKNPGSIFNDFSYSMKAMVAVTDMVISKALAERACA